MSLGFTEAPGVSRVSRAVKPPSRRPNPSPLHLRRAYGGLLASVPFASAGLSRRCGAARTSRRPASWQVVACQSRQKEELVAIRLLRVLIAPVDGEEPVEFKPLQKVIELERADLEPWHQE